MNSLTRLTLLWLIISFALNAGAGERIAFIPGVEIGSEKVLSHLNQC